MTESPADHLARIVRAAAVSLEGTAVDEDAEKAGLLDELARIRTRLHNLASVAGASYVAADGARCTERVRDHLASHGLAAGRYALTLSTDLGGEGRAVTTISNPRSGAHPWTAAYAERVRVAAARLPGGEARLLPVRDRVIVTWDGA